MLNQKPQAAWSSFTAGAAFAVIGLTSPNTNSELPAFSQPHEVSRILQTASINLDKEHDSVLQQGLTGRAVEKAWADFANDSIIGSASIGKIADIAALIGYTQKPLFNSYGATTVNGKLQKPAVAPT